jgi:hypothetical protein
VRGGLGVGLTALAIALGFAAPAPRPQKAEEVGTFVWDVPRPRFGGLSAIDLAPDGLRFVAVSDSAAFFSGRFTRGPRGEVTAAKVGPPVLPVSHHGTPLEDWMDDAEGVALAPGGGFYVSYESHDRIARYGPGGREWIEEYWPPVFKTFTINKGIEALAIDARGRLLAIPEVPPQGGDTPVYRIRGQEADLAFTLRRDRNWAPTGADFGPDGRLYLLERDFWPLLGFSSRVRRITLAGDRVMADEVIWQSDPGHHDNLEGLAAWQDGTGAIRLTLVSDDNFLPIQTTELVDLRVTE